METSFQIVWLLFAVFRKIFRISIGFMYAGYSMALEQMRLWVEKEGDVKVDKVDTLVAVILTIITTMGTLFWLNALCCGRRRKRYKTTSGKGRSSTPVKRV